LQQAAIKKEKQKIIENIFLPIVKEFYC